MKIDKIFQMKICQFYTREKPLYVAWACFRNGSSDKMRVIGSTTGTTGMPISFRVPQYWRLMQ